MYGGPAGVERMKQPSTHTKIWTSNHRLGWKTRRSRGRCGGKKLDLRKLSFFRTPSIFLVSYSKQEFMLLNQLIKDLLKMKSYWSVFLEPEIDWFIWFSMLNPFHTTQSFGTRRESCRAQPNCIPAAIEATEMIFRHGYGGWSKSFGDGCVSRAAAAFVAISAWRAYLIIIIFFFKWEERNWLILILFCCYCLFSQFSTYI